MIKKLIRDWLGGPYTNQKALEILAKRAVDAMDDVHAVDMQLRRTQQALAHEQQKFDALCDALGVVIVGNFLVDPPEPIIVSVHEDGLLGKANIQFFDAIKVQRQALIRQLQALSDDNK